MFAKQNAVIAGDDSGEVEEVPLEGDCGVLGGARDGVGVRRVADYPVVDGFKRQGYQQGEPEPWVTGSHIRTDGEMGVEVGWKTQGLGNRESQVRRHGPEAPKIC